MKTLIALACVALTVVAGAQEPIKVSYGDLDLTTKAGVESLYLRINLSAKTVCGDPEAVVQTYARQQIIACVRKTVDATVTAVRNQRLTQYAAAVR